MNALPLGLDADTLYLLDRLTITAKSRLRGTMQGRRRSQQQGSSLEFADYRLYTPGDDIRQLDWNAYGRTGKPFIKLFLDEQELQVNVFVDASASMNTGGTDVRNKFMYARQLTACIGYMTLSGFDRVSVSLFGERVEDRLPPLRGKSSFPRLLQFLDQAASVQTGDLAAMMRLPASLPRLPGVTWLISDLWFDSGVEDALNLLRAARQEVVVVHVLSPEERDPEWTGDLRLVDVESGSAKEVAMSGRVLRAYKEELERYTGALRRFCHDRGMAYVQACTDMPVAEFISRTLRKIGVIA